MDNCTSLLPPMPTRLRSADKPTKFQFAYNWIKAETERHGWMAHHRYEHDDHIVGKISEIVELFGENRARFNKNRTFGFEIRDLDGSDCPSITISAFGETFRVYHEHHFDARPVYPVKTVLQAQSKEDILADVFIQRRTRIMRQFSFWVYFLQKESNMRTRNIHRMLAAIPNMLAAIPNTRV